LAILTPIIRSSTTAVAASGLPLERDGSSAVGRGRGGRPDHDQQHMVFVTPLLLPAAIATIPDAVDTVVRGPDDGWRYHSKHVEQFPNINKLCKVVSCWIYIGIYLRCTEP
jgi:hypothetical protein